MHQAKEASFEPRESVGLGPCYQNSASSQRSHMGPTNAEPAGFSRNHPERGELGALPTDGGPPEFRAYVRQNTGNHHSAPCYQKRPWMKGHPSGPTIRSHQAVLSLSLPMDEYSWSAPGFALPCHPGFQAHPQSAKQCWPGASGEHHTSRKLEKIPSPPLPRLPSVAQHPPFLFSSLDKSMFPTSV